MKRALVVIDMQNGFINENTAHLSKKLIEFMSMTQFDKTIFTRFINRPETACYKFEGYHDCMEGSSEAEIIPELKYMGDVVFDKDKFSCWYGRFKEYIKINKFDKLYFVGVNTGCCVLNSVLDAYNDLQDCAVISDLCGSSNGNHSHQIALEVLAENITKSRVLTFDEAVKEIMGDCKGE